MGKDSPLLTLLLSLAPLSLMTIGGGLSIIGDLQRIAVQYQWFTPQDFNEIFALSRVAPGPATLIVTLMGWHVAGLLGALVASIAIFVPSSLLTYAIARVWHAHKSTVWQQAVARGLAPIAAGLILSGTIRLLQDANGHAVAWTIAVLIAILSWHTRLGPLRLLGAGAVLFVLLQKISV